jgi:hypothetical protein
VGPAGSRDAPPPPFFFLRLVPEQTVTLSSRENSEDFPSQPVLISTQSKKAISYYLFFYTLAGYAAKFGYVSISARLVHLKTELAFMIFSHQTRGAVVQILTYISPDDVEVLLYKHLGVLKVSSFLTVLVSSLPEALKAMVTELLAHNTLLRAAAPVKHIFESGINDLARWALHDGWIVENGALVRVTPAAEEATGVRDKFLQDLASSGLDADGTVRTAVENSSKDFTAEPPDFNG